MCIPLFLSLKLTDVRRKEIQDVYSFWETLPFYVEFATWSGSPGAASLPLSGAWSCSLCKGPLPPSRVHICFKQPDSVSPVCTLVGLQLEVWPEFTDAVSYESSPGHLGPTVPEVIVLLPRLLLNLAIRLLTSVTHSRLASWAVYDG